MASLQETDMYAKNLTVSETKAAVNELVKYPKVIRDNADPPIPNQTYATISYNLLESPVRVKKVDENGNETYGKPTYGFLKVRGTYPSETSALKGSMEIIRDVDSKNNILTIPVGRWVPITEEDLVKSENKYDVKINPDDESEVQLRDKATKKRDAERKRKANELKEREKELQDMPDITEDRTSLEYYTMRRKTEMELTGAIKQVHKKLKEYEDSRKKVWRELREREEVSPQYKEEWLDFMNKVYKERGIPIFKPSETQFEDYENVDLDALIKDGVEKFDFY